MRSILCVKLACVVWYCLYLSDSLARGFRGEAYYPRVLNRLQLCMTVPASSLITIEEERKYVQKQLLAMQTSRNFSILLDRVDRLARNDSQPLLVDRSIFNMAINAALAINITSKRDELLQLMDSRGIDVGQDTVRILLKYEFKALSVKGGRRGEPDKVYLSFFNSPSSVLHPDTRTLNTMMEGHRKAGNTEFVVSYYNLFKKLGLEPDAYTFSTLIRVVTDIKGVKKVLRVSRDLGYCTAPVVRCGMETLGVLGDAAGVLTLAAEYLDEYDSVAESRTSADSLVVGLLHPTIAHKRIPQGVVRKWLHFDGERLKEHDAREGETGLTLVLKLLTEGSPILGGRLQCGPKGLCVVFKAIQLKMKSLNSRNQHKPYSDLQCSRDAIWRYYKDELLALEEKERFSAARRKGSLNGRLANSLLQTFVFDVAGARTLWLKEVYPLARRLCDQETATGRKQLLEVAEMGLAALMYVSATSGKADVGLEIAKTARKREWDKRKVRALAEAYAAGKPFAPRSQGIDAYLTSALESSIETELGVAISTGFNRESNAAELKRIRIRY